MSFLVNKMTGDQMAEKIRPLAAASARSLGLRLVTESQICKEIVHVFPSPFVKNKGCKYKVKTLVMPKTTRVTKVGQIIGITTWKNSLK